MITTVAELCSELLKYPFNWRVALYSDENVDGIAIQNPSGNATTTEAVIEIPQS